MCRSPGQPEFRRCRHSQTAQQRQAANARQRMSRYARACDAAAAAGDQDKAQHFEQLMDKALVELGQYRPPPKAFVDSKATAFTAENTAHWSDEELEQALASSWDDPQAVHQLMHLIDERDANRQLAAQEQQAHEQAMSTWQDTTWAEPTPMTSSSYRPSRKLSANEQARVEYETYVDCMWLQAESDCNGVLLTHEARAKGIDSRSLFSGRTDRAIKYASPELQSWWGKHGRLNFTAFKYQMLGRDSDRSAATSARLEHFEMAPAW